jgi:hypothetical protein
MTPMQDQGSPIGEGFALDRWAHATVPAIIVDWLRSAAYAEIAAVAEALDTVAFANDRELHPQWFRGPAETLRQIYALLDAIGWSRTSPPVPVRLDVRKDYCWALMRALLGAADFADDDVTETSSGDVEQTAQDLAFAQALEARRVGALWDCIADVRARIDEWAVAEGNGEGLVLDIAA